MHMMLNRRTTAAMAAATVLAGASLIGTVSPARANAAECQNGANGFTDVPDTLTGTIQRSAPLSAGVTVTLQSGAVSGATRGWARISGGTNAGDRVWMDWTTNGGSSWLQCGPFTVGGAGQPRASAAKETNPSPGYQLRACGALAGTQPIKCTSWW
jgi:hypothetical protein